MGCRSRSDASSSVRYLVGRKARGERNSSTGTEVPLTWRRGWKSNERARGELRLAWTTWWRAPSHELRLVAFEQRRKALRDVRDTHFNRVRVRVTLALSVKRTADSSRRRVSGGRPWSRSSVPAVRHGASEVMTGRPRLFQPKGARGQRSAAAISGSRQRETAIFAKPYWARHSSVAGKLAKLTTLLPGSDPASANCAGPSQGAHILTMMPASRWQAWRPGSVKP